MQYNSTEGLSYAYCCIAQRILLADESELVIDWQYVYIDRASHCTGLLRDAMCLAWWFMHEYLIVL